jgi:outer membrane protein
MKNIPIFLNVILVAAVGFLFYKTFSADKTKPLTAVAASDSSLVAPVISPQELAALPKGVSYAFVNADTIFANYLFAKRAKASGESKVGSLQKVYQQKAAAFQKEYEDYVQKAGSGAYTKEQGLAIEAGLQKKKEEIMAMEQSQNNIMQEIDHSTVAVQGKIYEYLKRFNKEHGYACTFAYTLSGGGVLGINDSLDITQQVIAGLNNEYHATQGK